ncbi:MAG: hypothetical protein N3E47_05505 [Candidatus Bathyarchaeota archaeon]|nr:hypothetical protein [Candidatus Bathyarchaeota archaeon]
MIIGESKVMDLAVKISRVELSVNPVASVGEAVFKHGVIDAIVTAP